MYFETRHYIGDILVEPGARFPQPSIDLSAAFKIVTVCDAVQPPRWHGEVTLFDQKIIETEAVASQAAAATAVREAFHTRLVAAFSR